MPAMKMYVLLPTALENRKGHAAVERRASPEDCGSQEAVIGRSRPMTAVAHWRKRAIGMRLLYEQRNEIYA